MAKGLFTAGFTEAEVLAIQAKAKAMLLEGKTVMSYSDSGTSVGKAFTMPVADVLDECLMGLRAINPVVYPQPSRVFRHSYGGTCE